MARGLWLTPAFAVLALLLQGCGEEESADASAAAPSPPPSCSEAVSLGDVYNVGVPQLDVSIIIKSTSEKCRICCAAVNTAKHWYELCGPDEDSGLSAGSIYEDCGACPEAKAEATRYADESWCDACTPGRYNSPVGRGGALCNACPAGRYSGRVASTWCDQCPAGTWSSSTGLLSASGCTRCSAGRYSEALGATDASTCARCPAGRWAAAGARSCDSCPQGTWSDQEGLTDAADCTPCSAGKYSPFYAATSEGVCEDCPAGTWSSTPGLASRWMCEDCPRGTWSLLLGATAASLCRNCAPGKWGGVRGATAEDVCADCSPGKWSDIPGADAELACAACEAGRWSGLFGAASQSNCTACEAGRFSTTVGASEEDVCVGCPAGTWSELEGRGQRSDCQDCLPGRWSSLVAATTIGDCTLCQAGRWSTLAGASDGGTCKACAAGCYSEEPGADDELDCRPCEPGRWSDSVAAASNETCEECGAGRWSAQAGLTFEDGCVSCTPGKWSDAPVASNAGFCIHCEVGRYSDVWEAWNSSFCLDCPGGSFSNMSGMTDCTSCPPGHYSTAGAAGCSGCTAGSYQEQGGATVCTLCAGGRFSRQILATTRATCSPCERGSFAAAPGMSACPACPEGTFSAFEGLTGCASCAGGAWSPKGAHGCCPVDSDSWPTSETQRVSIPPGRHWSNVFQLEGGCDSHGLLEAAKVEARKGPGSLLPLKQVVSLATFHQEQVYNCLVFNCGSASCAPEPPEDERLMPGMTLKVAAYVTVLGSDQPGRCKDDVTLGFAAFGCSPGTISAFISFLVFVVSVTLLMGILFDHVFRRRVYVLVEASLRLSTTQPAASDGTLSVKEIRRDLQEILDKAKFDFHVKLSDLRVLRLPVSERQAAADPGCEAWTVEFRLRARRDQPQAPAEIRKFLRGLEWSPGKLWGGRDVEIVRHAPMLVREVPRLPGADLFDALELGLTRLWASIRKASRGQELPPMSDERVQQRLEASRQLLAQLMTRRALGLIVGQYLITVVMVILLPALAFGSMTCEEGYPWDLNVIWFLYVVIFNACFLFLHLAPVLQAGFRHIAEDRLRISIRFLACLAGATDIYQDATFPVIAGKCGFDLWWVSFWLVMLGVLVMQVSVHLYLIYKTWRRYRRAKTPEERTRHYIEGLFLALRASDNHVLVFLIKPAVEEHLGGGSSWAMKSIEARVAFLRFVFEDAEQAALQVSFLYFFENASMRDKVWIGLSTATSIAHSFSLCVQTLPEVRDWLWNQILTVLPGGTRSFEMRLLWLALIVLLYRIISIFPWVGACTPAGNVDDSTLQRLLLIRGLGEGRWPPAFVWAEIVIGSAVAFAVGLVLGAIAMFLWRKELRLTGDNCCTCMRRLRLSGGKRDYSPPAGALALPEAGGRDLEAVLQRASEIGARSQDDDDEWLKGIRTLVKQAKERGNSRGMEVLRAIDAALAAVAHASESLDPKALADRRRDIEEQLAELRSSFMAAAATDVVVDPAVPVAPAAGVKEPSLQEATTDGDLKIFESQAALTLDVAEIRGSALRTLSGRDFRKAGLRRKAEVIEQLTKGAAPLRMVHWSSIEELGALPPHDGAQVEDVASVLRRSLERVSSTVQDEKQRLRVAEERVVLVYVSHAWLRPRHPDSAENVKAKTLVKFARWLNKASLLCGMSSEIYFWIDYSCLSPDNDRGTAALPLFIAASTHVLAWMTPDFDRRCWPMLERLLAYSFCPGGMTPFVVNEASFTKEQHGKPGAASPSVLGRTRSNDRVVPSDELPNARVVRRVRRLPDPLDKAVCTLNTEAPSSQRKQVSQLVATALAVPALEIFADRQPVDFGRTEVVEQLLGNYEVAPSCGTGAAGERWLEARASATQLSEWRLVVELPGQKTNRGRLGIEDDECIVIVDRSDGTTTTAAPTAAEVAALFEAVEEAWEQRAAQPEALEALAVKLAAALRAEARAALASGDRDALRTAFEHCRGETVEIPEEEHLVPALAKAHLVDAIKSRKIYDIGMALRFTDQHDLRELPEYAEAAELERQLRIEELKQQARSTLRDEGSGVQEIVATITVAKQNSWSDIELEGLERLRLMLNDAFTGLKDNEKRASKDSLKATCNRIAQIAEAASSNSYGTLKTAALYSLETTLVQAAQDDDVPLLVALDDASTLQSSKVAKELTRKQLTSYVEAKHAEVVDAPNRIAFEAALSKIQGVKAVADTGLQGVVLKWIESATDNLQARQTVLKCKLKTGLVAMLEVMREASEWEFKDLYDSASHAFQSSLQTKCREHATAADIGELAKLYDRSCDLSLPSATERVSQAMHHVLVCVKKQGEPVALLELACDAADAGCAAFAGEVQKELEGSLGDYSLEALEALVEATQDARFKAPAARAQRAAEIAEVARHGREAAAQALAARKEEWQLRLDATAAAVDLVPLLGEAAAAGWSDKVELAEKQLRTTLEGAVASGGPDDYRAVVATFAAGRAQKVRSAMQRAEEVIGSEKKKSIIVAYYICYACEQESIADTDFSKGTAQRVSAWMAEAVAKPSGKLGTVTQNFANAARTMGDTVRHGDLEALLGAARRLGEEKGKGGSVRGYVEIVKAAKAPSSGDAFSGIVREAKQELELKLDAWKEEGNSGELSVVADLAAQAQELTDLSSAAKEAVRLGAAVETQCGAADVRQLCSLAKDAGQRGCGAWKKRAVGRVKELIQEAEKKGVADGAAVPVLQEAYAAASENGLSEVTAAVTTAMGGILPKGWDLGSTAGTIFLKKIEKTDPALLERIQKLVNETFAGFGDNPRPVTRDRKSGDLAARLKVEAVVHIENAMNYLSFSRRRAEVRKEFEELPDGEKRTDWDIKTRRVPMDGFEGDTPLDPSFNEAWLWHGTNKAGATGITDDDFRLSFAGSAAGTLFGRGLYFAESCMKADEYAQADDSGRCPFLLCRVALGRINYCDHKYPSSINKELEDSCRKKGAGGTHHAVIGDREKVRGTFREFIIFDNCQVYPEFLVWYRREH